jgi:superfamily I DNA/RNA helicase
LTWNTVYRSLVLATETREKEIPTTMRTWSTYQLAVFKNVAEGTGHTVVNAVAGSGKTTTIEAAVDYIPRGLKTAFFAFNKDIAKVLGQRLAGKPVEVSTLHSYGLKCITASLGRLTIDEYRVHGFVEDLYRDEIARLEKAITESKSEADVFEFQEQLEIIDDRCRMLIKTVSLAKSALALTSASIDEVMYRFDIELPTTEEDEEGAFGDDAGDDAAEADRQKFVQEVLGLLRHCYSTEDGKIDFDDMVWLPVVRKLRQRKFDRVFVDETQDLNAAQIELTLRACREGGRILAVGDPRQAIYAWRGADERAFDNVKDSLGATELPLSICYRCSKAVVRKAQEIVRNIQPATDAVEGEVINATREQMERGAQPGDFIISRVNAPLIGLCMGFLRDGRRANIQGRDVGKNLASFVKKSKVTDVPAFRVHVEEWAKKEIARLAAKKRDTQAVEDRAACLIALSDGAVSVADVVARIEELFSDKSDGACIMLSTTHKAKGLERDRVWLLIDTYRPGVSTEEANCLYVAQTRAKHTLVLVGGFAKKLHGDGAESA